jgi:hypothetical protein
MQTFLGSTFLALDNSVSYPPDVQEVQMILPTEETGSKISQPFYTYPSGFVRPLASWGIRSTIHAKPNAAVQTETGVKIAFVIILWVPRRCQKSVSRYQ